MSDLSLPDGLSTSSFAEILLKEYPDARVNKVESTAGSKAGNNYLSQVSRITVHFVAGNKERRKSFIIKDPNKATVDFLTMVSGIDKETNWYTTISPQLEKLDVKVGASCYMKKNDWLLLEDLNDEGYKVLDRKAMLDLEHCLAAVVALAKLHAVTHHLHTTNQIPDILTKDMQFSPECKETIFENFSNLDQTIENLESMGETEYRKDLEAIKPVIWDKLQESIRENNKFLSLVHGDAWTTNILFKYDKEDKVAGVKLIDFQLTRLASPCYDLHYFIVSSMRPQVRDNHMKQIYQVYLDTLNSTLKSVGSDSSLSNEEFNQMIKGTSIMGVFTALTFLPIPLSETSIHFEPPQDMSDEEKKSFHPFDPVLKQNTYRDQFLSLLAFYKRNNVI